MLNIFLPVGSITLEQENLCKNNEYVQSLVLCYVHLLCTVEAFSFNSLNPYSQSRSAEQVLDHFLFSTNSELIGP